MSGNNDKAILIVDDEPLYTEPMTKVLNKYGFNVTVINDPREVKEKFKPDLFDIVLLDMNMPHLNGHQVLNIIKDESPTQKVILVSGNPTSESECIALGFAGFLPKPYPITRLYETVVSNIG